MTADTTIPLPDPSYPEFEPYWSSARAGKIAVPACVACGALRWPPRPACPRCACVEADWQDVPPTGALYSWTVVGRAMAPGFADKVPYTVVIVESSADPQIRFVGNLVNPSNQALAIGMPLRASFRQVNDRITLVDWAPSL